MQKSSPQGFQLHNQQLIQLLMVLRLLFLQHLVLRYVLVQFPGQGAVHVLQIDIYNGSYLQIIILTRISII